MHRILFIFTMVTLSTDITSFIQRPQHAFQRWVSCYPYYHTIHTLGCCSDMCPRKMGRQNNVRQREVEASILKCVLLNSGYLNFGLVSVRHLSADFS